ncbi:hypothetical protein QVD17_03619 [Tagetes erecta]|uniref:Uncharacterized protein n=1 Tax=Tagetes erecta TaxID=13708 RepID=A0AAD8PA38_TARER|nr:hypothetical protein QVD17_03619 [Tagetes erecta]
MNEVQTHTCRIGRVVIPGLCFQVRFRSSTRSMLTQSRLDRAKSNHGHAIGNKHLTKIEAQFGQGLAPFLLRQKRSSSPSSLITLFPSVNPSPATC